ncbi:trichohyalin-like, partial [Thunnus maccoyii]|uniref:trichohyalin-like n=1 Tax=Thunnus maccoyii TaxID=8240 RepID=UPI001C4B8110
HFHSGEETVRTEQNPFIQSTLSCLLVSSSKGFELNIRNSVMESSIEASRTEGAPKPKLAPKPRLTPKPFSLQQNTTIRSIHAPKTVTSPSKATTHQTGKSEAPGVPEATLTTTAQKPPQQPATSDSKLGSVSVHTKDQPKTTEEKKTCPHGEDTPDSSVAPGKSDPASQSAPPKKISKSEPIQKEDVTQRNHNTSTDVVTNSEQKDEKKKEDETQMPVVQKLEESGGDDSSTTNPKNRWGNSRKRLSMELTSKFESGGLSLPPQPHITISTTTSKDDANQPVPPDPKQGLTTSEPPSRESDEGKLKEEYSGGGSIKRRISLLFDSSSRPEVVVKKEEPEIINGAGGVKERIKNWRVETGSEGPKNEKKPQVVPRIRPKSFDPVTVPSAGKTPKRPPVELPVTGTSSAEAADPPSKISPAEQPAESPLDTSKDAPPEVKSSETSSETSGECEQSKSTEGDVQLRAHSPPATHTVTDEGSSAASESAPHAPKGDNIRRRSVHFGVVERDDGGPPVRLCPETESKAEDEAPEDEDLPGSVPANRRVGILQNKDDEVQRQEEDRLKHLEFEKRRKAEESLKEKERLMLEEEKKQKEEEEEEKARLREEEMEREKQMELMWQRQREEERERAKQKEEILKQDQEEREKERLKEEKRKEERLREEKEKQRLREEEKLIHDNEEHKLEGKLREEEITEDKQREEDLEKEGLNKTEELRRGEDEEKKKEEELELMWQRQKEEDGERARQKEERLRQEEMEKVRLREEERRKEEERMRERQREVEEEERMRMELERKRQQEKEEMEKMRQIEMERQREMERKRQIEKERAEELERKRQEELERKRAEELEEKLRMEREREELMLTNLQKEEDGEREMSVDEPELNLISFDSEPQTPSGQTYELTESQMEVVYDDFSVRNPHHEVDFDDFSVKPKRWGSRAKIETSPVQSTSLYSRDEEMEALVPLEVKTQERNVPEQLEKPDSPGSTPAQENPEEEEEKEMEKEEEVETNRDEGEEDDKQEVHSHGDPTTRTTSCVSLSTMQYFGGKLSAAQLQVAGWVGSVRRSLQGALQLVWGNAEERQEEEDEDKEEEESGDGEGRFQRAMSPLRSFARRSRRSLGRLSLRSRQTLHRRATQTCSTQLNSYRTGGEDKDTDALIDGEPDQQNGACEPTSESDSPKPAADQLPEVSSEDVDISDFQREPELSPFPESTTPLLDTSAQKSKADLGKRRIRTRPSRSLHAGLTQTDGQDWKFRDSTVEKEIPSKRRESDSEEEQPKQKMVCSPPPTSQRVPIFPGLNPAALIAQIKKRTSGGGTGGGEETEDKGRQERESPNEELSPSPSQLSRSPRSAAHLAGAARVLPPIGGTDGGAISSPAWLKELKSKKRLSQHEGEA